MAFNTERVAATYAKEILKYPKGFEAVRNAVIDGTKIVANGDGRFIVESGQVMIYTNTPEIQTLAISAAGGTYDVTYDGQTAAGVAFDATASALRTALEGLSNLVPGDVTVTGTPTLFTITFNRRIGNAVLLTTDATDLTGGAGTATVVLVQAGTAPGPGDKVMPSPDDGSIIASQVAGILQHTTEIYPVPEVNKTDAPCSLFFDDCIFDTSKLLGYSSNAAAVKAALPSCLFE